MSDWIKFTDQAPPLGVVVLVFNDCRAEIVTADWNGSVWTATYDPDSEYLQSVTHWMPLPARPVT